MKQWCSPLLVWILGAGLWGAVAVERSAANDAAGTVVNTSSPVLPEPTVSEVSGSVAAADSCININRADLARLDALPGVGPVIAQRIIDFREEHGPFLKLSDLERVKGIGPATAKKIGTVACF